MIDPGFILPRDAQNRLLIERFSSKITAALYRNESDPVGLATDDNRTSFVKIFAREYHEVESRLQDPDPCKSAFTCRALWPITVDRSIYTRTPFLSLAPFKARHP